MTFMNSFELNTVQLAVDQERYLFYDPAGERYTKMYKSFIFFILDYDRLSEYELYILSFTVNNYYIIEC
jgi:hypothetical protein